MITMTHYALDLILRWFSESEILASETKIRLLFLTLLLLLNGCRDRGQNHVTNFSICTLSVFIHDCIDCAHRTLV